MSGFRVVFVLIAVFLHVAIGKQDGYDPKSAPSVYKIVEVIGNDTMRTTGTGKTASGATLNVPNSIWKDSLGFIYIGESNSNCVRKFSYPNGIVSVVAGICDVRNRNFSSDVLAGPATSSGISISSMVVDSKGVVYIAANTMNRVIAVNNGRKYALAGNGKNEDEKGGGGGSATSAAVQNPIGLWVDSLNQIYVSTYLNYIRKVDVRGIISTVAGAHYRTYDERCVVMNGKIAQTFLTGDNGAATCAQFNLAKYLFVNTVGLLYVSDTHHHRVRKVDASGIIKTIAGAGEMLGGGAAEVEYCRDKLPATSCSFMNPHGVVVDPRSGDVFIATESHFTQKQNRIYSLSAASGRLTLIAGREHSEQPRRSLRANNEKEGFKCSGCFDGQGGPATSALISPRALFFDAERRLFVSTHSRIVALIEDPEATKKAAAAAAAAAAKAPASAVSKSNVPVGAVNKTQDSESSKKGAVSSVVSVLASFLTSSKSTATKAQDSDVSKKTDVVSGAKTVAPVVSVLSANVPIVTAKTVTASPPAKQDKVSTAVPAKGPAAPAAPTNKTAVATPATKQDTISTVPVIKGTAPAAATAVKKDSVSTTPVKTAVSVAAASNTTVPLVPKAGLITVPDATKPTPPTTDSSLSMLQVLSVCLVVLVVGFTGFRFAQKIAKRGR